MYVYNYILITIICIWIGDFDQTDIVLGGYCPGWILGWDIVRVVPLHTGYQQSMQPV